MVNRVVAYWPKSSSLLFSEEDPRGIFAAFVEWVLSSCGSLFTVDDDASPTPNPVLSQRPSDCEELQHEPTVDYEPVSAVICEPAPSEENELKIAAEPELHKSDQVCEPAALHRSPRDCLWSMRALK